MSLDFTERRLRSLVAEISTLDPVDADEILALLPSEHRQRVEELLNSAIGFEKPSVTTPPSEPISAPDLIFSYVGLSPWLTDRLSGHMSNLEISPKSTRLERARFQMTALASDALRVSAEPFLDNSPLVEWPEEPADLSWIQRIKAAVFRSGLRP